MFMKWLQLADEMTQTENRFINLLIQFLPSLAITFLNLLIPIVFRVLARFEDYTFENEVKVTLARYVEASRKVV